MTFFFQKILANSCIYAARNGPVRHYDPLPRQLTRAATHSPTDHASRTGTPQHPGNLTIGYHPTVRYLLNNVVYLLKKRSYRHNNLNLSLCDFGKRQSIKNIISRTVAGKDPLFGSEKIVLTSSCFHDTIMPTNGRNNLISQNTRQVMRRGGFFPFTVE